MTRKARKTDELQEIPLFQEEGDAAQEGAEDLQEELEELLGDGDDEQDSADEEEYVARRRHADRQPGSGGGGAAGLVLGALLACAGVALGAGPDLGFGSLTQALGGLGIGPGTLVTVGLVLVFLAGMWGHVRGNVSRMADLEHVAAELHHSVDYLVEQQRVHGERAPASGEELDRVLVVMQRLDEKINNLTKAFKMYGKPLVEISNQSTDIAAEVNEVRTLVEAMAEGGALQEQLRAAVDQVRQAVQSGLEDVQQGFERMQQDLRAATDQAAEAGKPDAALERLEARLEEAKGLILASLERPEGSAGAGGVDLEGPIREIQREVAGLATTLASLQHRVGSAGGGRPAPQPAAAPTAPAAGPGPGPAAGGGGAGGGVLAHSIAGTKKAPGTNVLGAIAKLRQMRN